MKHEFQTEVNQLLKLIIHSLYSNKDIFLREIVSNGSDALDKLKYLTVSDDAYKSIQFDPRIDISFDEKDSVLTVQDSGIGMNDEDLTNNLGTIARSGTKAFMEALTTEAAKDSALIGQFGVGFYSAFMAAKKIDVYTRKAQATEKSGTGVRTVQTLMTLMKLPQTALLQKNTALINLSLPVLQLKCI